MEPKINLHELPDDELRYLLGAVENEQSRRKIKRKGELWEAITTAIINFNKEFGAIAVDDNYDEIFIDEDSDFNKIGIIHIHLEEED